MIKTLTELNAYLGKGVDRLRKRDAENILYNLYMNGINKYKECDGDGDEFGKGFYYCQQAMATAMSDMLDSVFARRKIKPQGNENGKAI